MPNKAQLDAQAMQLRESIHEINASDRTDAEKGEALDKVYEEYKSYQSAREAARRSDEMMKSLGEGSEEHRQAPVEEAPYVPSLAEARGLIARQLLKHPTMKANLERARKDLNPSSDAFEIDMKDATAGANLIGENLYGASGVSYSTPFGTGAVAAGVLPNFLPGIVDLRYYPLRFSTLLSSFTTEQPILSYLTEATSVRNAAQTAEDGTYPFSSGTFARAYEQVGKISNAMVLTDETIADAPMLVSFLQDTLLDGVVRQEDVQLLAGAGMPGVNGLLHRSTSFQKPQTITAATNVSVPASG